MKNRTEKERRRIFKHGSRIKIVRSGLVDFCGFEVFTFWIVWPCGVAFAPVEITNPHVHIGKDGPLSTKKQKGKERDQ